MAYNQQFAYQLHDQTNSPFTKQRSGVYENNKEASAVLDPAALSEPNTTMSPNRRTHYRRDSFTNSTGVLSPADSATWDQKFRPSGLGIEHTSTLSTTNPFHPDNNAFVRPDTTHSAYGHAAPWNFDSNSDTCTPTGFDVFQPAHDFEHAPFAHSMSEQSSTGYHAFNTVQQDIGYPSAPQVQTPMSPHSHTDWMAMAEAESKQRAMPPRLRSPPRTYADFQKRDGIRKKNARVEIPPERSLDTIERLINETTNEDEIKELKAQKRLLRNREAALASRQRKKKHTEDLEVKEKGFTVQISMLEKDLSEMQLRCEQHEQERQAFVRHSHEAQQMIHNLQFEKEGLVLKHTNETGNLRRKIQYLTEQLESGPAPAMSAAPSSTGFNDFTSEMDALNMGKDEWGNFFMDDSQLSDFNWDADFSGRAPASLSTTQSNETVKPVQKAVDPPVASGILFMLLLCGAFVTSKSVTSASIIPEMPEEVRAASTTVLNDLLKDSRADVVNGSGARASRTNMEHASSTLWSASSTNSGSHLDTLHQQLATPSKKQEADQVFNLTPAQYNSISNPDYPHDSSSHQQHSNTGPSYRRNLAQTLANMRQEDQTKGAAGVYTRSLLWDQIPADVVRQFKELIHESQTMSQDVKGVVSDDRKDLDMNNPPAPFGYRVGATA